MYKCLPIASIIVLLKIRSLQIKISHIITFLVGLYLVTSGIRAASGLGYGALESRYDPQILEEICNPAATIRLGPVGCVMTKKMLQAGRETVIVKEEPGCS